MALDRATPTYTLIIPHRNTPELLHRCLNSIPLRDDLQIIVVDDQSDPEKFNPNTFAAQYPSVELICSTRVGAGAGAARNLGLERARGKWLLFADADDFFLDEAFDIFDRHQHNQADVIYFGVTSVDSTTYEPANRDRDNQNILGGYLANKGDAREKARYRCWTPWAKMFRHALIQQHRIRFEEIPIANDAMFSIHAGYYAQAIDVDPSKVYCVTYFPQSITFSNNSQQRNEAFLRLLLRLNAFLIPRGKIRYTQPLFKLFSRPFRHGAWSIMGRYAGFVVSDGQKRRYLLYNIIYWCIRPLAGYSSPFR